MDPFRFGRFIAALSVLFAISSASHAQNATLSGFVTDASDGQPLEGATVALRDPANGDAVLFGAAADADGLYLIRNIPPGTYALTISFIGFEAFRDTLRLEPGVMLTRTVGLNPVQETLDEVLVTGERETGAAHVTAGHQRIRPEEIELIPSPDISADLASYLTTLPGIVTTGDRGGQFFVRGGEPSQNLVLLDGIILYQPFHVIGSYSAFPADIINRVDVFAGGYGPEYVGRLSSVIDVATRAGNNRRFAGHASISPFAAATLLEGPVIPGVLSFIGSARESLIERSGEALYSKDMPFHFRDAFGKLHLTPNQRSRISISGISTADEGTLVSAAGDVEAQQVRWKNDGFGARWLLISHLLNVATDFRVAHSSHEMHQGTQADTARSTIVTNTRMAFHASFFHAGTVSKAGLDADFSTARNKLGGLFQNVEDTHRDFHSVGLFYQPEFLFFGLQLNPGLRLQWYHVRFDPHLEPRLRVTWNRGMHQISGATGIYHQEIVGLYDRRDAASIFTAWTNIPKVVRNAEDLPPGRLPRAVHGILGYRGTPTPSLTFSVEGFYKRLSNLFVSEWTSYPRFTTRLQPARGQSAGFDMRLELRRGVFYGYINYGLSSTSYAAEQAALQLWYGVENLHFRPPHDRRHQINALASASLAGFDVSARWSFGSGLPFSRAVGFDGFILLNDFVDVLEEPGSYRVIYERPYNDVLPTYHRLDVSMERTFDLGVADVSLYGSAVNLYDRRNLFYLDIFTLRRTDQLPLVLSFGIKVILE